MRKRYIVAVIVLVAICLITWYLYTPPFVTFRVLSAAETEQFIRRDDDGYVRSMTRLDLIARGAATHEDYIESAVSGARDMTSIDILTLSSALRKIDDYLLNAFDLPIDAKKLRAIPWIIALTAGREYENGYPHTRGNVIFIEQNLLSSGDLTSTLLHEKVHVYQRMFPDDVQKWLEKRGYARIALRINDPYSRANPDLDAWIYKDPLTSQPMIARYRSAQPSHISDVELTNPAFEHPYEFMAYEIADAFNTMENKV